MAEAGSYGPVKLFCGVLYVDGYPLGSVEEALENGFGPIDYRLEPIPFLATDYYAGQMGESILRTFVSFERLGAPEELADAKLLTNELEKKLAGAGEELGRRPVNLDPGFLNAAQLVLASAKAFAHRIPLRNGIYAQLEYLFRRGGVQFLEWTFPEYREARVTSYFLDLRSRYMERLGPRGQTRR